MSISHSPICLGDDYKYLQLLLPRDIKLTRTMPDFQPRDLLFPLVIFTLFYANQACNQMDRNSLLSLPFKTPSPPLNWSSINCCQWEGISCDHKGQVKHIWLPSKGLRGSISPFLANLTHLSHLNLSYNSLSGFLPTRLFSPLNQLKMVDFSNNDLEGDISLLFSANGSSLCINSPFIRFLDFSSNHYRGQIPRELGGCSKLEIFRAGFNSLSGPLPPDMYLATRLQEISLPSNNLSGLISEDIVNLTRLSKLELYRNNIGGKLPSNIGKLSQLKHLLLQSNSFIGHLSPSLMNCTNLMKLNLAFNFFEGKISALNFSNLHKLSMIDLLGNHFTGNFPASLYSCKSLRAIRLGDNRLEGEIRPEVVQLKFLSFLSLSDSKLTNITKTMKILMHCKALNILFLPGNFLKEPMPTDDSIVGSTGFSNLQLLSLANCQLTGQLPAWLSKLKNLEVLFFGLNRITGSIPAILSTLPRLFFLDLDNNLLSGEFPKELCALPALVSPQPLDNTSLNLSIYVTSVSEYKSLYNLRRVISVVNNSLSGNIPIEIGHLKQLQRLELSHNNLSGKIPDKISELTNLEKLDLSANQLTGEIPASLANLHFLNTFSIARNKLHRPIPSGTQLQSFDASAYEGNPRLCGPPLPNQCPHIIGNKGDKAIQDEENKHAVPWLHISVVLGFITGFWGVCGPVAVNSRWRFAYFRFFDNLKDRIYVKLVVFFRRLHRRLTTS